MCESFGVLGFKGVLHRLLLFTFVLRVFVPFARAYICFKDVLYCLLLFTYVHMF